MGLKGLSTPNDGLRYSLPLYENIGIGSMDADPNFTATIDYTTQRYVESQIYSGAMFDTGGGEDIQTYHDRGAYYYFAWPRKLSHCVCCY